MTAHTPRHTPPSARAASKREEDSKAAHERHARSAARPDPTQLPPEQRQPAPPESESSPVAKENPPQPQQGMSSSTLNTATSAQKDAATKEAEDKPHNNMD